RARPDSRDDHDLDGERRILGAPQTPVGKHARDADHHNQEQHQSRMSDRPRGKIEVPHIPAPNFAQNESAETTFTFCAGSSFCTPSVTMLAPSSTPPLTRTSLLSYAFTSTRLSESLPVAL